MDSRLIKRMSYVTFGLGVASVLGSAATYLLGQRNNIEGRRNTGVFVGLWAPTLFAISEMLDRISEEDTKYMGVRIERGLVTPTTGGITERAGRIAETARALINR